MSGWRQRSRSNLVVGFETNAGDREVVAVLDQADPTLDCRKPARDISSLCAVRSTEQNRPSYAVSDGEPFRRLKRALESRRPRSENQWMVGDTGLEPVTSCMSSKCSNQLS